MSAYHGAKDQALDISVDAGQTGLTDIEIIVTKPDGTDEASNLTTTEVGTKGIYEATYTPAVVGTYYLQIVSPTATSINGRRRRVLVQENDLDTLASSLSTVNTNVLAVKGVVDDLDSENGIGFID